MSEFMGPLTKNLVVADGQVGTVAAAVTSNPGSWAERYNLLFSNVGAQTETLIVTQTRNGGTPRRVRIAVLDPGEALEITGLPVNVADMVLAVTTDAGSVDYLVSKAGYETHMESRVYDASGLPKSYPQIFEQLAAALG
jgi:hypothetical protein